MQPTGAIRLSQGQNLIVDGNFNARFTGWVLGGNTGSCGTGGIAPPRQDPTIATAATLGPIGSDGNLTQRIAGTTARQCCQLSFLLRNVGATPNDFSVAFDGQSLALTGTPDGIILPVKLPGSTAFDFQRFTTIVTATSNDVLQFTYRQDPSFYYLTGVSLTPSTCASGGASQSTLTVHMHILQSKPRTPAPWLRIA